MGIDDAKLISNVQIQLGRLMQQLSEIEQEKYSLGQDEYLDMRNDTMEQLEELEQTLSRVKCGDVSLIDQLTATKLAIQGAVSEAFKTPETVAVFARKEPALLRQKLMQLETAHRLRKIQDEELKSRKLDILLILYKLNDHLSDEEKDLIRENSKISNTNFELASDHLSCDETIINVSLQ